MTGIRITKEHFQKLSEKEQNLVIFEALEDLMEKFKQRKRIDTAIAGITGFVGGSITMAGKWLAIKAFIRG